MTLYLTTDEATTAHTRSLVRVAQALHGVAPRSLEAVLAGHRTRSPLTAAQRRVALEHRRLLTTITGCGHGDVLADNLAGFWSAYRSDPQIVCHLAA